MRRSLVVNKGRRSSLLGKAFVVLASVATHVVLDRVSIRTSMPANMTITFTQADPMRVHLSAEGIRSAVSTRNKRPPSWVNQVHLNSLGTQNNFYVLFASRGFAARISSARLSGSVKFSSGNGAAPASAGSDNGQLTGGAGAVKRAMMA